MSIPRSAVPFFERNGYIPQKKLGHGTSGVVVQALSLREDKKVAIKIINREERFSFGSMSPPPKEVGSALPPPKEVTLLKKVQTHPNVIQLHGVDTTEDFVFLVMELAEGGTLTEYIKKNNQLSERTCRALFRDLIMGIKHCHDNHVVHGDIHGQNLLLIKNGTLKLSDFGLAGALTSDNLQTTDEGGASDIWSAGIVLYTMIYGYVPYGFFIFPARFEKEMSRGHDLRPGISDDCKDLIQNILQRNQKDQLTPAEVFKHPWMEE